MSQSPDYYRQRETQERASAERADGDIARNIHLDLANRYAALRDDTAPPRIKASVAPNP